MKIIYSKIATAASILFLVSLIFGAGFFFGNTKDNSFISGSVSAEEPLEMNSFWKTFNILEEKFVKTSNKNESATKEDKIFGAISGLVQAYGDPYTVFLPPTENKDFTDTISGSFQGVGMEVGIRDKFLTVISPLKNSPAEKAGIKTGDKILSIDKKSAMDLSVDEAIKLIRGVKGTVVSIGILREGEKDPMTIDITRDVIVVPTIDTKIVDNTFVISLYNFSSTASTDFRNALREFVKSKKTKLVLDLRGNPGGFLESAVDISSWFLPAGKTVVIEDFGSNDKQKIMRSRGYAIFNGNLKMAILIDEGSASASEIVAGALQEHGIAKLVGKNTFGKGSVQELIDITENTSLKVTIARWLTPNGKSISDGGLTPDFDVEIDPKLLEKGTDTQLQKAIEVLK